MYITFIHFRYTLKTTEFNIKDLQLLETINQWHTKSCVMMKQETLFATKIIEAASTKNKQNQGDPEIHETKIGN